MTSLIGRILNRAPVPYAASPGPGPMRWLHRNDATGQLAAFGSVGTLFAIVNRTSNATAQVNWRLYRKTVDARRTTAPPAEPTRPEVTKHAAIDLWNNPNPFMTGMAFREAAQQHLDLVGESTIVVVRNPIADIPLELWPVRPDRMTPIPHPTDFLTGWVYTGPNGEKIPLSVDEVIQIKMPNPLDPYRGLGPVQAALVDIDSAKYSADWNRNFFINSAEPGGVLETPNTLTDPEFEQLNDRWRESHQGVNNAHRVAILEHGLTWKPTMFSPKDMQFVQLRGVARELIREAFGIHAHMLGISENVNKANAEAGEISFARWLVFPRAQRWKDALNHRLLPMYRADNVEWDHDRVVPEDRDADNAERNSRTTSWATLVNAGADPEEAAQVVGLPPLKMREPEPAPAEPDPQGERNPDRDLPEGRSAR